MHLQLDRKPAVLKKRGVCTTRHYEDIKNGLWTPPVHDGRTATWPEHETDALIAARIAGKSVDEIRALVQKLIAARQSVNAAAS